MRSNIIFLLLFVSLTTLTVIQGNKLSAARRTDLPEAYVGYAADVPPALTFVMAGLAGFRGVIAEILWFRVSRLQEDGHYLELAQLAEWITKLDPHAAEAWAYNAWNLAYNVSIMMTRDEDRLRWVNNGIQLLRDEGLRFNPKEAKLYRELAWIYQNKIGDSLDSAHLIYKLDLAGSIAPALQGDGSIDHSEQAQQLLQQLKLDRDLMLEVERKFAPLDWRLPESHALYWAYQGSLYAEGSEVLLSRRAVYQPLLLSVFHGRLTGNLARSEWQVGHNIGLVVAAADYLAETAQLFPSHTINMVYTRFLATAVQFLHHNNDQMLAQTIYQRLKEALPAKTPTPSYEAVTQGWMPQINKNERAGERE